METAILHRVPIGVIEPPNMKGLAGAYLIRAGFGGSRGLGFRV